MSNHENLIGNRRTYYAENLNETYAEDDDRAEVDPADPATNLISSEEVGTDMHLPVIDLDFPCSLVPSATPGHFHLYLGKPITWTAYQRLLEALCEAGIVERGFCNLSLERGASFVRHPDHPKAPRRQNNDKF